MKENRITIQFSCPKNLRWILLSNIIRWSEYKKSLIPFRFFGRYSSSHCSILIEGIVTEAVLGLGVRQISYEKWVKLNLVKVSKIIDIDAEKYQEIKMYLLGSVGVPYATLSALGIFYQRIVKFIFKKEIANPFPSIQRKVKCSQLCYEILKILDRASGLKDGGSVGVREIEEMIL